MDPHVLPWSWGFFLYLDQLITPHTMVKTSNTSPAPTMDAHNVPFMEVITPSGLKGRLYHQVDVGGIVSVKIGQQPTGGTIIRLPLSLLRINGRKDPIL